MQTSRELGEQLLTVAQNIPDSELLVEAHMALGTTLFYQGELVSAKKHLEQGQTLYDAQQHRSLALRFGGYDPAVYCLSYAPAYLWLLGYPEQALKRSQ